MFTPLPGRNALGVPPDQIIAIIESINAPSVALPELGTGPTKAYLVGCLTPSGRACIFCYLLQTQTNRPSCFISQPAEVALDAYTALEAESIQFVESMGFMLDNLNFRSRLPHEQALLFETLPFFRDQVPHATPSSLPPGPGAAPGNERAALGRFLAQF
jgi:hypothetical protein